LPDDLCFGFAQKPFDRTWVADLSCVGVFCATNQYVASAANIFAQMNFHIFPANYRWEEGEEPPTWPWPLPDKVAQGFFFGTVTLTYFYAPEPGSIALLSIAIASLGFTRRRKLHRVTL
jgi:hypothetical protein